jgi:hypothetical protein
LPKKPFLPQPPKDCPGEHQHHQVSPYSISLSPLSFKSTGYSNSKRTSIDPVDFTPPPPQQPVSRGSKLGAWGFLFLSLFPLAKNLLLTNTTLSALAIMGISRDSRHKRSASGAKRAYYRAYNQ